MWSTIPLKNFHLFKIVSLNFFFKQKLITDSAILNKWKFFSGMVDKWRDPPENSIIFRIKEGKKSDRQLLPRNSRAWRWEGRARRWVAFKLSVFSHKKASTFFFFPPFKLPFTLQSSNSLSPHVTQNLQGFHFFFFFFFKLKKLTQKRLSRFYLVTFFSFFFFPLNWTEKALDWAW